MRKFMKVSVMVLVAMFTFSIVADAQEVKMTSYGDEEFALQYPSEWEPKDAFSADFIAEGKDGVSKVEVLLKYEALDAAALKTWVTERKELMTALELKSDEAVTKENITTIRSVGDKEIWDKAKGTYVKLKAVCISFAMVSNGKTLTGNIWYQQKDDAKMKHVVEKILASLKVQSEG